MRLELHPQARVELQESALYYEASRPGLGAIFVSEIEWSLRLIVEAPKRWAVLKEDIRRCLARRFPYAVLYTIEEDYILVVAIMHYSRKPNYWQRRLNG